MWGEPHNHITPVFLARGSGDETTPAFCWENFFVLGSADNVLTGSHANTWDENSQQDRDCQEKPLRLWLLQQDLKLILLHVKSIWP